MGAENERDISEVQGSPVLAYGVLSTDPTRATPLVINPETGNIGNGEDNVTPTDMDGQSPNGYDVTTVSTEAIPANPNRVALIICNDSDTAIYLGIGESVAVNNGIRLNASGGSITLSRWGTIFSTEAIQAIHDSAGNTKRLSYQEFI